MKSSVCLTIHNEEKSISGAIEALLSQSKKPNEIVIVDAESTDKTVQIVRHWQKKDRRIKLLVKKCSRAEGRNIAVDLAKNEIIAMTDAGCVANKDWLKNISSPFKNEEVDVVAGFYEMKSENTSQEAMSVYLGVLPIDFDIKYLPSTRSIAFRKKVWEKVGGFPEKLTDTAEDTAFNFKLIENDVKIARVKNAIVEWGMPKDIKEFYWKIFNYAKGDVKSSIWWHPAKKYASHNIKAVLILIRYIFGVSLLFLSFKQHYLFFVVISFVIIYAYFSFRKTYIKTSNKNTALWGAVVQFISDAAVIAGFSSGLMERKPRRIGMK